MPAYPTHSFFSHLALQALIEAKHPLAGFAQDHAALFRIAGIAGADIQCMPYQVCGHCKAPYRHDQKSNRVCLVCKHAALQDFYFRVRDGRRLTRRDVEENLYANTHLVLYRNYRGYGVPRSKIHEAASTDQPFPAQVVNHVANCLRDAPKVAGRKIDRYITFVLGWFSHVVSDALFKGVYPQAVRVNFFGNQYHMNMLPAAETLTLTDLAQDFGVNWPLWHEELLRGGSDGGALRHLAMGNSSEKYDPAFWTEEFGKPDERFGRTLDALREINGRWFHEMYTQPDYSAPTPRLDALSSHQRASARFQNLDLGQVRRYAIKTGWYTTFIKGVEIYLRVVNEAAEKAGLRLARAAGKRAPNQPNFRLWRSIVEEADPTPDNWGSVVRVENEVSSWIANWRRKPVRIISGVSATNYQEELSRLVAAKFGRGRSNSRAGGVILIGTAQYNSASHSILCIEESLRLKYERGLAAYVRADGNQLLLCGFSDFGYARLIDWFKGV
jgi:hypothetical protein